MIASDDDQMIILMKIIAYNVAATAQRELSESETKRLTSAVNDRVSRMSRTQTQLNVGVTKVGGGGGKGKRLSE